ncbi:pro-neuregulin-4, membrane-bound isoform [Nematolebias whitei]|uniref:pro-neuregulin-4, membrane-bound isoform n=1 Tax=Nematolebias whitei TaxID=451745 RepID=UPI00189BBFA6|nr:pro-neuregulin-4, membrane-bound isoform [Nematolebias whitei]
MMAEHGNPCDAQDATYCLNGASCYELSSMKAFSCVCRENYKGSRCELYELLAQSPDEQDRGLLAAVVIVGVLILVVLAVIIYYVVRMLMLKPNNQNNRNSREKKRMNV